MTDFNYDIPILVTIKAKSYEDALRLADELAEGIGMTEELSVSAVSSFEYDNEGQRVLYLHNPEDAPVAS